MKDFILDMFVTMLIYIIIVSIIYELTGYDAFSFIGVLVITLLAAVRNRYKK